AVACGATTADAPGAGAAPLAAGRTALGRSSTLPLDGRERSLDRYARPSVQTKNTAAHTAVVRDRKLALPVAPNRLPDAPLPTDAPMSAPLPCCTSTSPNITSAARIWTSTTTFNNQYIPVFSSDS